MVTKICQGDIRWKHVLLGPSNAAVGAYGCTTCAMCMSLEKLRGYFCDPGEAARVWAYDAKGRIIWGSTDWDGMSFVKRVYQASISDNQIKEYANGKDTAVILEVNHGAHWAYCDSFHNTISIIDPVDGKYYRSLPSKYTVTGYTLFKKEEIEEKIEAPSGWAAEAWYEMAARGVVDKDSGPHAPTSKEEVCVMLKRFNDSLT